MGQPSETVDVAPLVRIAAQLRRAAADADRPDVVAKADEIIVLLAGDRATRADGEGKAAAIIKFLDGLGF
jgi:hypothetical protein